MDFKRIYSVFTQSVLVLGPRGTGKSSFIKNIIKPNLTIDLLKTSTFKALLKNPSDLEDMILHLTKGNIVFIHEIQKIPDLLNEVHRLIEDRKIKFILTWSSARKLKSAGVNLLAGRALNKKFFPLTIHEIEKFKPISALVFSGLLPNSVKLNDQDDINDYLFSYVDTYLKEEIFQEGLSRNLSQFTQFIELAGQYHGQIISFENISREIGVSGDTVKAWFQILEDTLLGQFIEPYKLNFFKKEVKHSKFYFFDCGIARAAEGIKSLDSVSEKNGFYFESIILNELKAFKEVSKKDFSLFFYSISGGGDIDFIIETKKKTLSKPSEYLLLNIKYSKTWKTTFQKFDQIIIEKSENRCLKSIGIYQGSHRLKKDKTDIYPTYEFIEALWKGKIL